MKNFTRILALPLMSAAILSAELGMAGTASAKTTVTSTNGSHAIVSTPDTTAHNPTVTAWSHRHRHHHHHWNR